MKEDVLGKILYIEKEINQQLETEKEKIGDWLKQVREDSKKEISAEKRRLLEPFDTALKNARIDTEKKAAEIIRHANIKAGILGNIGDESLNKIISRHINCIFPEE